MILETGLHLGPAVSIRKAPKKLENSYRKYKRWLQGSPQCFQCLLGIHTINVWQCGEKLTKKPRRQKMLLKFHAGKKKKRFVSSCFYLVAECVVQYSWVA